MSERAATNDTGLTDTPSAAAAAGAQMFRDIGHLAYVCEELAMDAFSGSAAGSRDALLDDINRVCAVQRAVLALAAAGAKHLDELDVRLLTEAGNATHEETVRHCAHRQKIPPTHG